MGPAKKVFGTFSYSYVILGEGKGADGIRKGKTD